MKIKYNCCNCSKFIMFKEGEACEICRLKNKKVDPLGEICKDFKWDNRQ